VHARVAALDRLNIKLLRAEAERVRHNGDPLRLLLRAQGDVEVRSRLPGGFGTLDEIFEALTLKQTGKIHEFPVILMGRDYWQGMIDWLKGQPLENKMISQRDLRLFQVTDDVDEVVQIIDRNEQQRRRRKGPKPLRDTP
jgi:hypothetical protein